MLRPPANLSNNTRRHALSFAQPERLAIIQPRVARHELPWVIVYTIFSAVGAASLSSDVIKLHQLFVHQVDVMAALRQLVGNPCRHIKRRRRGIFVAPKQN